MKTSEVLKSEIERVYEQGKDLANSWKDSAPNAFLYHEWYAMAYRIVNRFLPERTDEFRRYYEVDTKRKEFGYSTYVIQDYFRGVAPSDYKYPKFNTKERSFICLANQLAILNSIYTNIDTYIFDLDASIYYGYQEDELDAAKTIIKVNIRAAGALCGVVIEKHLKRLLDQHKLKCIKKNPGINELSLPLKDEKIIDIATWRKISYLADIRNLCDHAKIPDPTKEQVQELIDGSAWLINTVF